MQESGVLRSPVGRRQASPSRSLLRLFHRISSLWVTAWAITTLGCNQSAEPVAAVAAAESQRPPIILISIDTLRADRLPVYGYSEVETPAIDELRSESILFSNAYTSVPLTLPAHASLLTGLAPFEHGVRDNIGYRLEAEALPSLAGRLADLGYRTGAAVSSYVLRGRTGLAVGFDEYDDGVELGAGRVMGDLQRSGGATIAAAQSFLSRYPEEPLFLFLHLFEPHTPYDAPEPFRSRFRDPYDAEIAAVDAALGEFFGYLEREGILDRALILLVSDHGEGLGDHGEAEHGILLYPETMRVPMLLKLPEGSRGGETIDRPVQLLDVVPTVLEIVGGTEAAGLLGRSLLSEDVGERSIYLETYYPRIHLGWSELRSVVTSDYQYVDAPRAELYDLNSDPKAETNVLRDNRRVGAEMSAWLEDLENEFQEPGEVHPDDAQRLQALGYLASSSRPRETRAVDPKEALPVLDEMGRAFELAAEGRCDLTVGILKNILTRYPGMMDARCQLAKCLEKIGRLQEALVQYETILENSPQVADEVLLAIGRNLYQQQRWQEAEQHARAAVDRLPSDAYQLLARIALARGLMDEALALATSSVQSEQLASSDAMLLLANIRIQRDELPEALELLEELEERVKSKRHDPIPTLDYARGSTLARLGRIGEAEEAFLFEIRNFPSHLEAYEQLCYLYASVERRDLIQPLLEAMIKAEPSVETMSLAESVLDRVGIEAGHSDS